MATLTERLHIKVLSTDLSNSAEYMPTCPYSGSVRMAVDGDYREDNKACPSLLYIVQACIWFSKDRVWRTAQ